MDNIVTRPWPPFKRSGTTITQRIAGDGLSFLDTTARVSNLATFQLGASATPVTGAYYTDYSTGYFSGTGVSAVKQVSLVSKGLGVAGGRGAYGALITTDATDNANSYTYAFGAQLDDALGGSGQHLGLSLVGNFSADITKSGLYDLVIANSAHDASGNGKNIIYQTAAGTDSDDNGGSYEYKYAASGSTEGDGLPSKIIYGRSGLATGADDASSTVLPWYETSAWNTDTTAAVNGAFAFLVEGQDGDNSSGAFGEFKVRWLSDDFSLEKAFIAFSDNGLTFDIVGEAEVGTQEVDGNLISFEANAWNTGDEEGQGVYYSMQALANAGASPSADLAFLNNAGDEKFRLYDDGNLGIVGRILGVQGTDVASANDITLLQGNYFDITGTTETQRILGTGWTAGSEVTLQFDGSVQVTHNTAAGSSYFGFQLAGAGNFSATAGDTLTLVFDGAWWRETARTAI